MECASHNLWALGYRLTYAEIEVENESNPGTMKTILWQELDRAPDYPVLSSYLTQWQSSNEAKLSSVRVMTLHDVTQDDLLHKAISLSVH